MSKLCVFDLDETLFSHDYDDLKIYVKDENDLVVDEISWTEYVRNNYQLLPIDDSHRHDFCDFTSSGKFKETATPIPTTDDLLNYYSTQTGVKVEILTARSDFDCQETFAAFMVRHGIDIHHIHVRRAGNLHLDSGSLSASIKKKKILEEQIKEHGYNEVTMFDDSLNNLTEFLKLKKTFPGIKLIAYHVDHLSELLVTRVE